MRKSLEILYKGNELEIHGDYNGGFPGSYEQPPDAPSFEIDTVMYYDCDITALIESIDSNLFSEFEKLCLEEIENDIDYGED